VIVYALGFIGVLLSFIALNKAKGRPQNMMMKTVMNVMSGAYMFSWSIGSLIVYFLYDNSAYIAAASCYLFYVIVTGVSICCFLKNQRITNPYTCEVPRRYGKSDKKHSISGQVDTNNRQQHVQYEVEGQNNENHLIATD